MIINKVYRDIHFFKNYITVRKTIYFTLLLISLIFSYNYIQINFITEKSDIMDILIFTAVPFLVLIIVNFEGLTLEQLSIIIIEYLKDKGIDNSGINNYKKEKKSYKYTYEVSELNFEKYLNDKTTFGYNNSLNSYFIQTNQKNKNLNKIKINTNNNKCFRILRCRNFNSNIFKILENFSYDFELTIKKENFSNSLKKIIIKKEKMKKELNNDIVEIKKSLIKGENENNKEYLIELIIKVEEDSFESLEKKIEELRLKFIKNSIFLDELHEKKTKKSNKNIPSFNLFNNGFIYSNDLEKATFYNSLLEKSFEELEMFEDIMYFNKKYIKVFEAENISFLSHGDNEKSDFLEKYKRLLNSMSDKFDIQIKVDKILPNKDELIKLKSTGKSKLSIAYNEHLDTQINKSIEQSTTDKIYFIFTAKSNDFKTAKQDFNVYTPSLISEFKSLGTKINILNSYELTTLYFREFAFDYSSTSKYLLYNTVKIENMSILDKIKPSFFKQKRNYIQKGKGYERIYKVEDYPLHLDYQFLSNLLLLNYEFNFNLHLEIKSKDKRIEELEKKSFSIDLKKNNLMEKSRKSQAKGLNFKIPSAFIEAHNHIEELQETLKSEDENMFKSIATISLKSDSLEKLEEASLKIESIFKQYMFKLNRLNFRQKNAMFTTKSLGQSKIINKKIMGNVYDSRTLITSNITNLVPFTEKENFSPNGFFFGLSKIKRNVISVDRTKGNGIGFYFGRPGSGKSLTAKNRIIDIFEKRKNDDIFIIDPEIEYGDVTERINGKIIKLDTKSNETYNPLELIKNPRLYKLDCPKDENPYIEKSSFMIVFLSLLLREDIDNVTQGIIDITVKSIIDEWKVQLFEIEKKYEHYRTEIYKKYIEADFHNLFYVIENSLFDENKINIINEIKKIKKMNEIELKKYFYNIDENGADDFSDYLIPYMKKIDFSLYSLEKIESLALDIEKYIEEYKKELESVEDLTLKDFHRELKKDIDSSIEKKYLYNSLVIFVEGSKNIFADKGNIQFDSQYICVQIGLDMDENMKLTSILLTLEHLWKRIIKNKAIGKRTWVFMDEFYLLCDDEMTLDWMMKFIKRVRKYHGIPTAITQNIVDLLDNRKTISMISNADFVCILNQGGGDLEPLKRILNISDENIKYMQNIPVGEGLIWTKGKMIPFENLIPQNNYMYSFMNTSYKGSEQVEMFEEDVI